MARIKWHKATRVYAMHTRPTRAEKIINTRRNVSAMRGAPYAACSERPENFANSIDTILTMPRITSIENMPWNSNKRDRMAMMHFDN